VEAAGAAPLPLLLLPLGAARTLPKPPAGCSDPSCPPAMVTSCGLVPLPLPPLPLALPCSCGLPKPRHATGVDAAAPPLPACSFDGADAGAPGRAGVPASAVTPRLTDDGRRKRRAADRSGLSAPRKDHRPCFAPHRRQKTTACPAGSCSCRCMQIYLRVECSIAMSEEGCR